MNNHLGFVSIFIVIPKSRTYWKWKTPVILSRVFFSLSFFSLQQPQRKALNSIIWGVFFFFFFFFFNFRTYKDISNSCRRKIKIVINYFAKYFFFFFFFLAAFLNLGVLESVHVHSFLWHKKTFFDSWSGYGKENHPTRGQVTLRTNRDKTIGLSLSAAAIVTSALLK